MLQIKDTLISLDLLDQCFLCDLSQCKGACCIEGEAGAPLEKKELETIEAILPVIWEKLSPAAQAMIEKQGITYIDAEGDTVTTLVEGKECVFACWDEQGICQCAIEKAWQEGLISFRKPISCHLYPVRLQQYPSFTAINYSEWSICSKAREAGQASGVPLYRFLKEALVRKFGQEWYDELCLAADWYSRKKT